MIKFNNIIGHITRILYYQFIMANIGYGTLIIKTLKIDNPKLISIGSKTYIGNQSWLMGVNSNGHISLKIGDRVQIGHFAHIVAMENVDIENEVLLADKVFISDCTHNYENISKPVLGQSVRLLKHVIIGEGTWLGENVCVCGASIGKHCVIGANSVVTQDIPDYSVAVGSPAKVIKKYDFKKSEWIKC